MMSDKYHDMGKYKPCDPETPHIQLHKLEMVRGGASISFVFLH